MYARIVQVKLTEGAAPAATTYFRDSIGPALKAQPGFLNSRCLVNSTTNDCLMVTLWDSETARQGAEDSGVLKNALQGLKPFFADQPQVSYYEVAVQVA